METLASQTLTLFANSSPAAEVMRSFIMPVIATLCTLASLACVFFLVNGGIQYMSSSGKPDKLEYAKKIIKNALVGLALVIAAATLTAILSNAYSSAAGPAKDTLPALQAVQPVQPSGGLVDVVINAVVGFLRYIIQSIGEPFLNALAYFINSTPLMADNSSVFNIWLAVVGITDALFILVVALLGFHVMSFSTFGFDELDVKHMLPQLALVFLLANTSIFAIDGIISLSNAMIYALHSAFVDTDIWRVLAEITKQSADIGLAGLLVMVAFLVLSVMLLVYYVGRLITLYLGAILSPLIVLIWLIPVFKDFAITALKTYLTTVFVLFVHVVILLLASSIFTGMLDGETSQQPNNLMALIVGLATVVALLKTQGTMRELSYAASAPRAARELGGQFIRGLSSIRRTSKSTAATTAKAYKSGSKLARSKLGNRPAETRITVKPSPTANLSGAKAKAGQQGAKLKTGETRKAEEIKD